MRIALKQWLNGLLICAGLATSAATSVVLAQDVGNAIAKSGAIDTQIADELKLANESLQQAFEDKDIWKISQLWANEDYVSAVFPASARPAFGWDNVRNLWQYTFAHNRNIKLKSTAGTIYADKDDEGSIGVIIDLTSFEAFQTQTGQPIALPGMIATKIFERKDGKWLLVHYHAHQPGMKAPASTDEESGVTPISTAHNDEIRTVERRFYMAMRNRNIDEMQKIWSSAPTAVAIQPESVVPFFGRDNIIRSWQAVFDFNKAIQVPSVGQSSLHIVGETAWSIGSFEIAIKRRASGAYEHQPSVLATNIYKREGGEWKLAHYHAHIGPLSHTHGGQGKAAATLIDPGAEPDRTVELDASEMTFGVSEIEVRKNELVRFVVTNTGVVPHEFGIATPDENRLMQALMRLKPDMTHNSDSIVTVNPGETKELLWRVPEVVNVEFSCNLFGHAEAGMKGVFKVIE